MNKKLINKYYSFSTWKVIDGTLGELQARVNQWVEDYGHDAKIDCCDNEIDITQSREETDEEYQLRIIQDEQSRNRQDYHEKIEYERLKKKFGQ